MIIYKITTTLPDAKTYDHLTTLAQEYSTTKESLVDLAVNRLLADVVFFRELRNITVRPDTEVRSLR